MKKLIATSILAISLLASAHSDAALMGLHCKGEHSGNSYTFDFEWGSFLQKNAQGKVIWSTEDGMLKTRFDKHTGVLTSLIRMRTNRQVGAEVKMGNDGKYHGTMLNIIPEAIICDGIYAR